MSFNPNGHFFPAVCFASLPTTHIYTHLRTVFLAFSQIEIKGCKSWGREGGGCILSSLAAFNFHQNPLMWTRPVRVAVECEDVCVCESHSFISFASVAALDFSVLSHILFLFFSIRLLCVLVDGSKNLKCRQKAPKHDCRKTLCKAVNKRSKDKSAHFCTQFVLTWQLKWKKIFYDFWNDGIFE